MWVIWSSNRRDLRDRVRRQESKNNAEVEDCIPSDVCKGAGPDMIIDDLPEFNDDDAAPS